MHTTASLLPNLPPSVAREVYASLCDLLPPSRTDTPEARIDRDETAMAGVAGLHPADAFEALLAAQIIAADAHAKDCLRAAAQAGRDLATALRCRAQAAAMMRHMHGGLRALQRSQSMREKAEAAADPAAMERAGWWFRDASVPLPDEDPEPAPGQGQGPSQGQGPAAAPADPGPASPEFSDLSEAEQYAVLYPDRAARIRTHGGLPARLDFGPPEPELVNALVNGTSPLLRALDQCAAAPA